MKKINKSKLVMRAIIVGLALTTIQQSEAAVTLTYGAQIGDTFALATSTLLAKNPVATGSIVSLGYYDSAVTASTFSAYTSASQFLTNWTQLATTTMGFGTGEAGSFAAGYSIPTGTNTYVGKQLAYIVGNASSIASSTQLGVFTSASWIVPTNPTGALPATLSTDIDGLATSGVLYGSFLANGGTYADAYKLATINAIPEPSSASLLALGVAGLVALRARRKS